MNVTTIEAPLFSDMNRRSPRLPVRIILLAVLLHLLLLGIPARTTPVPESPLEVTLSFEPRAQPPAPETVKSPAPPLASPEPSTPALEELAMPPKTLPASQASTGIEAPAQSIELTQEGPTPDLDRNQLLQSVARMDWSEPEADRGLARSTESAVLNRLFRPLIARQENVFDGMSAPTELEIVDNWLEPGGTHRVVIRTPDGQTLCGRQEPMNSMRPWLQMPMMFHACGGGGKRSGRQDWRNN